MSLNDKLKWSKGLADRVMLDYKPYAVLVGYTSGGDSNVALKLASMFMNVDAAFTCDTTIGAIETLKNCESVVRDHYHCKYICQAPKYNGIANNSNTYFDVIKQHGFPGKTKLAHNWMYWWLKDHTINAIITHFRKRKHNRNIVIISGARKHESVRRVGTSKDITVSKNAVWVNICNEWTDQDVYDFAVENNLDQLRSPISKSIGVSGECFCGCYSHKGELTLLKAVSPSTYQKIIFITKWLRENTNMLWDWESGPPQGRLMEKQGQINMFSPGMLFCSTCMNNA